MSLHSSKQGPKVAKAIGVANDPACQCACRLPPCSMGFHGIRISCPLRTIATVTVNTKRSSSFCIHRFPVMNVATSWLKGSIYYSSGADLQVVAAFIFHLSMNVATSLLRGSIYYSSGAGPQMVATFILQSPG